VADLSISLACWDYDRMLALKDGTVKPEGIQLTFLPVMMPEPAFRMLRYREFDAAEMSLSWYTRTVLAEERPFVAIPVFPSRMFRHSCVYVNAKSGISEAGDLVGKRVGCPEYQMTAAVWIKGILADRHEVPVDSVEYRTGGLEQPGRTETPMNLPPSISVTPIDPTKTLSQMLEDGEIDALYTAHRPSSFRNGSGVVRRLWADPGKVEREYFADTGIFPIMHVIVIRWDTYTRNRWLATSLMKALEESKKRAYAALNETTALKYMMPFLIESAESTVELMGSDPFSYGLQGNEKNLATFCRYSFEQGLTQRLVEPSELFAAETLELAKI
jgi:4,5-dihydroxyphthalate decarboxylase